MKAQNVAVNVRCQENLLMDTRPLIGRSWPGVVASVVCHHKFSDFLAHLPIKQSTGPENTFFHPAELEFVSSSAIFISAFL